MLYKVIATHPSLNYTLGTILIGETTYLGNNLIKMSSFPTLFEKKELDPDWVEIKSIDDVPKNGERVNVFWTLRKQLNQPMYKNVDAFTEEERAYWVLTYSHFKRMEVPLPPRIV